MTSFFSSQRRWVHEFVHKFTVFLNTVAIGQYQQWAESWKYQFQANTKL
jgi:hypothetical protein